MCRQSFFSACRPNSTNMLAGYTFRSGCSRPRTPAARILSPKKGSVHNARARQCAAGSHAQNKVSTSIVGKVENCDPRKKSLHTLAWQLDKLASTAQWVGESVLKGILLHLPISACGTSWKHRCDYKNTWHLCSGLCVRMTIKPCVC